MRLRNLFKSRNGIFLIAAITLTAFILIPTREQKVLSNHIIQRDKSLNAPQTNQLLIGEKFHPRLGENVHDSLNIDSSKPNDQCFKQIHIWTDKLQFGNGTRMPCPGLPCGIHQVENTNLKTLEESDAVFFHPLSKWDWDEVHALKRPGQKWMTGSWESPINTRKHIIPPLKYRNNTYDYLITFRRHEGIINGDWGKFDRSKPSAKQDEVSKWAQEKSRLVVWTASNCNRNNIYLRWNRTEFVYALSKLVQVDMYGRCGNEECPRGNRSCVEKIETHKFYLALENTKCRNYITEKVWDNSFRHKLVPIVYGPPREDYELILPPKSFIFVEDFRNLRELSDYLLLLDMRDDLYNEYHEWRMLGTARSTPGHLWPKNMCRVVARILEDERAIAHGTYKPIPPPEWDSWWLGSCHNVKDFPIDMD